MLESESFFEENGIKLFHYRLVDSTNKRAIEYAQAGGTAPTLFLADGQTAGSGRLGRSFFSPAGTGLYMTLLTEMSGKEKSFSLLTSLAAVCARDSIEELFGVSAKIKWVNDLYLDGKKVAGILAQSFFSGERRFVALGVGINISTSEFPPELADKAGSLMATDVDDALKRDVAFVFCKKILDALESEDHSEYMERYRCYSCVIGRRVRFSQNGAEYAGVADGITDDGALEITLDSCEKMLLSSGEISLFAQ